MKTVKYTIEIDMPDGDYISAGWIQELVENDVNIEDPGRCKVKVAMEEE